MAIVTLPSPARIKAIQWTLDRPAQINTSGYTGRRTVVANPWHGKWRASVELAAMDATMILGWRAFLAKLKGQINTFRLPASEGAQNANLGVVATSTAAAGATSITLTGATTALLSGQFITVNEQLLQVTDVSGSTVTFQPPLRVQATAGTGVVTANPYALVAMTDSMTGWTADLGPVYGVAFEVEEVIGSADTAQLPDLSPYAYYALALDFDSAAYWVNGTSYALTALPGYAYTRSGAKGEINALTGADLIDDFAANVAGVVPDIGYWSRRSLTNAILHSQEFANGVWSALNGGTVASNTATAPDGATTADVFTMPAGSASRYQLATIVANSTNTQSVFARKPASGGATAVRLSSNDGATWNTGTSTKLVLTTAWQRLVNVTTLTTASTSLMTHIGGAKADGTFDTDCVGDVELWQAQVVAGNVPDGGPIIATTTATATVGEDSLITNIKADGSALADQDFLLFAEVEPAIVSGLQWAVELHLNVNDRLALFLNNGLVTARSVVATSFVYEQSVAGAVTADQRVTLILRRLGGALQVGKYVGGVLTWGTSAASTIATTMTKVVIGNYVAGTVPLNGRVRRAPMLKTGTFDTDVKVLAEVG